MKFFSKVHEDILYQRPYAKGKIRTYKDSQHHYSLGNVN